MKKFLCAISLFAIIIAAVAGEKEYDPAPAPSSLYFVMWTNIAAASSTLTITNTETYMWTPYEWKIVFPSAKYSTNTFKHIYKETIPQYEETRVVTNDFGNIQTNYLHGLTNTAYVYVTNTLSTVTNGNAGLSSSDSISSYIQRGDIIAITRGDTNETAYVKITGKR